MLLIVFAENTPNAPEFICSSPKVLDFNKKRLHWVSVVRELLHMCEYCRLSHGKVVLFDNPTTYMAIVFKKKSLDSIDCLDWFCHSNSFICNDKSLSYER